MANNSTQYYFSAEQYLSLLNSLRSQGHEFITFGQKNICTDDRYCLMRHDIDVNVQYAQEMSQLEFDRGVKATYFFMLTSPAYNLMGRHSRVALQKIVELGHEIGLHFDAGHPSVNEVNMIDQVMDETGILEKITGTQIKAVSFHQPSSKILRGDIEIPGLINTYNRKQMHGWYYISDSNRKWIQKDTDYLSSGSAGKRVQILIHPMWWMCEAVGIERVWEQAIETNFYISQRQYLETERAYGGERKILLTKNGGQ